MITGQSGLGWNPLSKIKHAATSAASGVKRGVVATGHGVKTVAVATGHGVATGARVTGRTAVKVTKTVAHVAMTPVHFAAQLALAPVRLAMRPVKNRINTLVGRRATKIAWDKRKSKTPTAAENTEARSWVKSQLNKKLPHGPLMAMMAGAPSTNFGSPPMTSELGAIPAVVIALIPVFIAVLNIMLRELAKSGEAPVQIGPNGEVVVPQGVDPAEVPESGGRMPEDSAEAAIETPDGALAPGGGIAQKGNLMLFGGIGLGIVVLLLVMKKKD